MKISKWGGLALAIATAGLFAFSAISNGSIKGKVSPANAATQAWIVSATDTLRASVSNGMFEIPNVKPGTYRLIIEAKPPFKNASKESVIVNDGQVNDLGEIVLGQ
jgi:Polysaccharide lyase family 4, domain II